MLDTILHFLLWTALPTALGAAAALRLGGDKLAKVFQLAKEILANAKEHMSPRDAVLKAIEHVFLDDIDAASTRLDAEVERAKVIAGKPSMVDDLMDGMDVTIIPPDGTEEFKPVFPSKGSS